MRNLSIPTTYILATSNLSTVHSLLSGSNLLGGIKPLRSAVYWFLTLWYILGHVYTYVFIMKQITCNISNSAKKIYCIPKGHAFLWRTFGLILEKPNLGKFTKFQIFHHVSPLLAFVCKGNKKKRYLYNSFC